MIFSKSEFTNHTFNQNFLNSSMGIYTGIDRGSMAGSDTTVVNRVVQYVYDRELSIHEYMYTSTELPGFIEALVIMQANQDNQGNQGSMVHTLPELRINYINTNTTVRGKGIGTLLFCTTCMVAEKLYKKYSGIDSGIDSGINDIVILLDDHTDNFDSIKNDNIYIKLGMQYVNQDINGEVLGPEMIGSVGQVLSKWPSIVNKYKYFDQGEYISGKFLFDAIIV